MSMDNISDLGTQGLDELVPSRYAVQVGDIDVLVISDGVLPITAKTLATNADATEYGSWLDDRFLPHDVLDWPLNVVVVRSGDRTILVDAGLGVEFPDFPRAGQTVHRLEAAGIDPARRDRRGAHPSAHGPRRRPAHRRIEGPAASGSAGPRGGRRGRVLGVTRLLPHRHACAGAGVRFGRSLRGSWTNIAARCGLSRRSTRWRRACSSPEPAVTPPGTASSDWRPAATRLTFAGDAVFAAGFDNPEWHNGFEHDPEEAARVRIRLLQELAATGESLVATHLPFPSVCRVAAAGDVFRCVPTAWDY